MGQLSTLPRAESALAGNGQGRVWSGAIERRTNYSTYYEAKGREFFIKKKGENERKDKGIRKDYADLKGKPAYHTEDKGNIPSTTVTPETIKGRVASAYNKSEDKKALSADFVLSAQPISDGYTTLQQEVEDIIDQAIADYESDTGKQWQGDRNELLERAAVFVRGMFLAADKRIGSKDKSGETRWNGIQTYVDEKLAEVENNQVVWDVLSEINARAEEKFVSMSKAARTEAAREFTTEIPERRRHMVASPVQAFAVQEENDKQREGGKKNSEEGLRDRIAKRKERDAEKKKKKEEEREKKEEERKKKAEEKAAKKAEEDAKQANERDRLAQALLDKHGSIAEYLKNTAIPDFTYKGKPITLFEYLTSTGKERKLINEEYSRQHTITQLGAETTLEESADLATTVKQMLNEGANQVIYSKRIQIESGSGKKTTAISPKTSAKTLEAILAAEQEAKTTQHIKDGMAELGLELAEEKTQEPIDETNEATDETKLTEEPVDEEVVEEQPKPTKRGQEKQEVADEEELDDYERERENERADDEADEAFLRQQEAEFENQLGGKDKGQSRQSDEALRNDPEAVRQRIEFLEEKVDYEMATPEEEAELADLRQRLADMQSDPRFSIGSENRTAATPAQSAATQAVLDMLEKAGIEVEQVSDEEAEQVLNLQNDEVAFANSQKSTTFVPTSKVPKEELAVAHQALFARVQDHAEEGTSYGVYSAKYFHIFNGSKHQYAIPIVGNEDRITQLTKLFYNDTNEDGTATRSVAQSNDSGQGSQNVPDVGSPKYGGRNAGVDNVHSGKQSDGAAGVLENGRTDGQPRPNGNDAELLRTPDGVVYGYVRNGKIYLTARGLNPNTPIHEYTHLWDTACQRANPELWKRGVELMKQLPLWEEVFIVFLQMHCNFSR